MRGAHLKLLLVLIATMALSGAASLAFAGGAVAYSIWPLAGSGTACSTPPSCGDGGPATVAQLAFPEGVAVSPAGDAYIADYADNEVRKLSVTGTIGAVAGGGTPCSNPPACGDGGPATDAQLSFPDGVAVDQAGNVYIADTGDNEVRKVSPGGNITRLAGNGTACASPPSCGDGGSATAAQLRSPFGVAVDRAGNVYVADAGDNEVRKVSPSGKISRVAGAGTACAKPPNCGDGSAATSAQLNFPAGVAADQAGNVYIADDGDNEVRKVASGGTISRIAGSGTACSAPPACGDGGPAVSATLGAPDGVAVDHNGNVYVADDLDNEIRKVSSSGTISRIAGSGAACAQLSSCGNGGSATSAQLNYPDALAVDPSGNVYVGDTFDQQLRWLSTARGSSLQTTSGSVSLLAFEPAVARTAVTVRYALSGAASLSLSVTPSGGRPTTVGRASGRAGWGELSWNRRIGGAAAGRGRYTLTVTATVGGRSATSSVSVRL
jgi:sugar lactone lactonase YvrE